jgi:hypothetical protein
VPPPPVAGATAGMDVAEGAGVVDGPWLGVADGLAEEVSPGVADALADGLAEELGETVAGTEEDGPGDSFGSFAAGADPEQAAIEADASRVAMAQPAAVSRMPKPAGAVVARVLIRPPHKPGS